jgi:hypothetical protein
MDRISYRGKHFTLPQLSDTGTCFVGRPGHAPAVDPAHPIIANLNGIWDLAQFQVARRPVSLGVLSAGELAELSQPGLPRVLDMPIKFPGSDVRVPAELARVVPTLRRIFDAEAALNRSCLDEYYAYLTVDQGPVSPGRLQREAPCHVDGFQGARWCPKVRCNHSYVVADAVPTTYYVQPFDFSGLDEARHNFFWEMNRQVALTGSRHAWRPRPGELCLIDGYTVHRGSPASEPVVRTWIRVSFEVRIFDRLGNAHNPMFAYDWPMVRRDIEGLSLVAFDPDCDPSLRVFPWQKPDGTPWEDPAMRTSPDLTPETD